MQETAKTAQKIIKEFTNKEVEIASRNRMSTDNVEKYFDLIKQHSGKRILIVGNRGKFRSLRTQLSQNNEQIPFDNLEIAELPTYTLTNDLDKRILAELHKTIQEVDTHLNNYILDEATKSAMDFIDKLTNRRLRRSRRRFRSNGMNDDKHAAYATLYRVLKRYLQILAPFAPFITEHLRLALNSFIVPPTRGVAEGGGAAGGADGGFSIHLSFRPITNRHYINQTLIDEIATVRKIIKLALFVRAKNKIAVKQPLQKLEVKID